jgi:hypothetical protein
MNIRFANKVAAAAAVGLLAAACGESTPEPATPATPNASSTDSGGDDGAAMGGDEEGADATDADGNKDAACCKGLNECAGKGGCHTATNECAGKNECKGKGGCNKHCPATDG